MKTKPNVSESLRVFRETTKPRFETFFFSENLIIMSIESVTEKTPIDTIAEEANDTVSETIEEPVESVEPAPTPTPLPEDIADETSEPPVVPPRTKSLAKKNAATVLDDTVQESHAEEPEIVKESDNNGVAPSTTEENTEDIEESGPISEPNVAVKDQDNEALQEQIQDSSDPEGETTV
uniref:SPK domain-containing protein n=1 Tax=Steinernema glaseri TaxID=37863 RepID=A0A1I7YWL5_9BILA